MWRAARSGRCHNGDEDVSFGGGDGESGVFWGAGDDAAGFSGSDGGGGAAEG